MVEDNSCEDKGLVSPLAEGDWMAWPDILMRIIIFVLLLEAISLLMY